MYMDLLENKKLNSVQYLSGILVKQLLNQNICRNESMKDKIIDCNNALLNNSKEDKIIRNYEENFQDIKDLNNLFNLLFTKKSDFDRKQFSLAQKVSYPNLYKLAESGKSLRFIIENDVLKYKTINKVNKIVLPPQVRISTFTSFHIKGIHKKCYIKRKNNK